jgi:hypothetical protein
LGVVDRFFLGNLIIMNIYALPSKLSDVIKTLCPDESICVEIFAHIKSMNFYTPEYVEFLGEYLIISESIWIELFDVDSGKRAYRVIKALYKRGNLVGLNDSCEERSFDIGKLMDDADDILDGIIFHREITHRRD